MARIFIAIRFDEGFKQGLVSLQDALKARDVQGKYCPYGNLHLTLAFIGGNYDLTAIRKAVKDVPIEPFELTLGKLGSFPTKAGVIWCGLKNNTHIIELAKRLRERLKANGVSYKDDLFFPHISLVQHPSEIVTDIEVPETSMRVEKIFIMKSERVDGELIYSEIDLDVRSAEQHDEIEQQPVGQPTESVCRGRSTQSGYPRISWSNECLGGRMTVLRELRKR